MALTRTLTHKAASGTGLIAEACPVADLETLALLDRVPFQDSRGWWRVVTGTAIETGLQPQFWLVHDDRPVLLMPLLRGRSGSGRRHGLTTPYTSLYQPTCAAGADLEAAGFALAPHLGPLLQLDALDPEWRGWGPLLRGLARAGRQSAWFASFANWRETLQGRCWSDYLAARPGALRETIRRRLGRAERDARAEFSLAVTPQDALAHLAEYDRVHARSWKEAEPFPDFAAAFVAEAALAGVLRIAVLREAGEPIAAQFWTVENGTATLHKLVHDEAVRARSPGTVLTAWMIRRLIDEEQVMSLDFGRGDDPYKRLWAGECRRRAGLVVADPWHPLGAAALLRQVAGSTLRRLRPSRDGAAPDIEQHAR
ncbi:GNAT family N-acetyltransferase [Lichenicola sp.]|uniref:GNAT family N-acetyltransferase n=1 Tax=Lichenicola sp. TaxID=2804529 RepID=UPI003AFF85FC